MTRKYSSTSIEQLLNASIGAGDTTLSLASTAAVTALLGGVTLAAGNVDQFTIVIDPDTASEEIIFVRGTSGSTLTGLVRGQAGTSGTAHSAGATIKHVLTSNDLDFYTSGVDNAVTLTGTATLTNKTIALGSNTISGTTAQFNAALTDGDFATLAGTQTLTNKTLTAPVISSITNTGTITLPTSTDTLVGRATTDTLTNKTLTTPVISSITNTGTITLPTSTDTLVGRATTDTLTNKTINYNDNTITNLPASLTLLSTTTLSSGASTATVSSISGSYTNLMIDIETVTAGNGSLFLWLNSSNSGTSAQCVYTSAAGAGAASSGSDGDRIVLGSAETGETNRWVVNIYNYTSTQAFTYSGKLGRAVNHVGIFGGGGGKGASYSAITLEIVSTTLTSGTIKIYGIKQVL